MGAALVVAGLHVCVCVCVCVYVCVCVRVCVYVCVLCKCGKCCKRLLAPVPPHNCQALDTANLAHSGSDKGEGAHLRFLAWPRMMIKIILSHK